MRRDHRGLRGLGAASSPNLDPAQEGAGTGNDYLAKRRDFYIYESQALTMTPGTQQTDSIQIEADSNFILQKLTYFANVSIDAAAFFPDLADDPTTVVTGGLTSQSRIIPAVAVQIIDTGSGRQLMQAPIPIPSFFGTGELPFILPNPRLFMRNSTIQIQYTSFDTTNAYDIRLAFLGYKVYGTA